MIGTDQKEEKASNKEVCFSHVKTINFPKGRRETIENQEESLRKTKGRGFRFEERNSEHITNNDNEISELRLQIDILQGKNVELEVI